MLKTVILFLFPLLFISIAPIALAAEKGERLAGLTVDLDKATFRLEITDEPVRILTGESTKDDRQRRKTPGFLPIRRLIIQCIDACERDITFEEEIDDYPLGVFRLWDGSAHLITIWGGATSYRVRVYGLGKTKINKIFEESTIEAPQFLRTAHGRETIILVNRDHSGHQKRVFWGWDGVQYHPVPH